jgi:hypothetical protein
VFDIAFIIGSHALKAADGYRFFFLSQAASATGRLAGSVAGTAQDAGEHIRFPVDHVGVGITLGSDKPDVFGYGSMRRAGILTVYDLMEVFGILGVGRFQGKSRIRLL